VYVESWTFHYKAFYKRCKIGLYWTGKWIVFFLSEKGNICWESYTECACAGFQDVFFLERSFAPVADWAHSLIKTSECHSNWGGGERTDQSESAACHLSTIPTPSHMQLTWHSGTEVVTSGQLHGTVFSNILWTHNLLGLYFQISCGHLTYWDCIFKYPVDT
jgi:hypothetical protein